jgi:hypothetical protein
MVDNIKDCSAKIEAGGEASLVYPAMTKDAYTLKYSTEPLTIANVGDKSLL